MPERSKVNTLPEDVRRDLETKLVESGFTGYADLTAWLQGQGYEISKSSLHRYGSNFEERLRKMQLSTRMAHDLVNTYPDDEGKMNEAMMRLLQDRIFTLLLNLEAEADDIDPKAIASLTKAVSQLSRADVYFKTQMREIRSRIKEVAQETDKIARNAGLSKEQASMIRAQILGITGDG